MAGKASAQHTEAKVDLSRAHRKLPAKDTRHRAMAPPINMLANAELKGARASQQIYGKHLAARHFRMSC